MMNDTGQNQERLKRLVFGGKVYRWRVSTLWKFANNIEATECSLAIFESELDADRWFKEYVEPTVNNIIAHFVRVCDADLNFPIIVWDGNFVLDGMHRLAKAKLLGNETVSVKFLAELPPSDIDSDQAFFA